MKCIECSGNYIEQYYEEVVPCSHCDGEIVIHYFACMDCGIMWKEVDGEVIDNSVKKSAISELEEVVDDQDFMDFDKTLTFLDQPKSMQDLLHKCIRCEAPAYEVSPNCFRCSICDFEWEIH